MIRFAALVGEVGCLIGWLASPAPIIGLMSGEVAGAGATRGGAAWG